MLDVACFPTWRQPFRQFSSGKSSIFHPYQWQPATLSRFGFEFDTCCQQSTFFCCCGCNLFVAQKNRPTGAEPSPGKETSFGVVSRKVFRMSRQKVDTEITSHRWDGWQDRERQTEGKDEGRAALKASYLLKGSFRCPGGSAKGIKLTCCLTARKNKATW